MSIPLRFYDISIWLAISSIILLITTEFLNPHYGQTGLIIVKTRLRKIAIIMGILFLATATIRILQLLITL